ncbi:MAG: transglutaminase domain-containing protein [Nitrospirota bacterium]
MKAHHNLALKIIAVLILFFFTWTFGGLFDIAYAVKNSQQAIGSRQESKSKGNQQSKPEKPEEKFQRTLDEIEQIIQEVEKVGSLEDEKKNKLKTKKTEIDALDVEIKKQFAETEKKLKDEGLPQEILDRHYNFVKHYNDNLKELKDNLDAIDKAKTENERGKEIEKAKKFLEKVTPPKKHTPLDPNKLPHRTMEPVFIEPRTAPEQFTEGVVKQAKSNQHKPILVASNGSLDGLLASANEPILLAAANPPTSDDLSQTIEVQFTPAIQAKAAELNHNPTKIYNWVRNNIEYVPTHGSIQGADYCLQTKQCNDFDTASLLIALLRTSGIHARYVYGTIELPIEKVKNWLGGFTDSMEALRLLASARIPVKGLTEGGAIKAVQLEHVWVEAWVDYIPSRGARHRAGQGDTWIPLDASFKQYAYKEPMDFPQAVGFNTQNFVDEVLTGSTIDPINSSVSNVPQELILQRMQEYVQSVHQYYDTNLQGKTIEDIVGSKKVVVHDFPYLLGTLPYKTITVGNKYSQLPDSLRWRITFQLFNSIYSIDPDLSYTASTASLTDKSITLSYRPSTTADEALIQKYGYIETVPPYLLNLTPELIIGGETKVSGIPVGSGRDLDFVMTFISPKGPPDIIRNKETAGAYLGIGLDLSWLSKSLLDKKIEVLNQIYSEPSPNMNRKIQEGFSLLAAVYFAEVDAMNMIGERFANIVDVRLPSAAIVGEDIAVHYIFDSPITQSFAGLFIDVDRDIHTTQARDGDKNKVITFNIVSGMNGSAMEHALWEQIYKLPGISAIKILKQANEMGIANYKIDQSNISSVLPMLQVFTDAKNDIINAVNAGKIVYIPKANVQYYGWEGTAYIVMDPNNGTAGYIISQGLSGGADGQDERWWDCTESLLQLFDTVPLCNGQKCSTLLSVAIDHVAFALALSDIGRSSSDLPTKGKTSIVAYINLIVGIASLHPRLGKSIGFVIAASVVEFLLWANAYRLNEGKWPILEENPLGDCSDLFTDLLCDAFGC